jgi:DNA polymerase III gamma/tau subunit
LLRRLLLLAAGAKGELTESEQKRLAPLARAMPYENLLRAVSLCVDSQELARRADNSALVVQMLALKLTELPRLKKLEEVLSSGSTAVSPPAASAPPRADSRGPRIVSIVAVEPEPATAAPSVPARNDRSALERFHSLLEARRRITAAQASLAESIELAGEELVLRFGIDKAPAKEALEEPATRKLLAEVAREAFGRPLKIALRTGPPADGDLGQAARDVDPGALSRERATSRVEADPVVRSALELFRGELTEVKEEE